jgi:uncharacterized protein (TIGR02246 family)
MSKPISTLPLTIVLILFAATSFSQTGDISAIKKLNNTFLDAIVKKDTSALSSVLASDFILINPGGHKQNKAGNLANVLLPNQVVTSIHIDSEEVRLIGTDVGLITAWTTFVINVNGKKTTGKNCYQDVYVKRKNGWKAVAAHVTLLGTY